MMVREIVFLANANAYTAPIVSVSHEYVAKGRGSVLPFVPIVEVRDAAGRSLNPKVDTFDESPRFLIGQQMQVCNSACSGKNTMQAAGQ